MQRLYRKRTVFDAGGSTAAYKSTELVRRLRDQGVEVRVMMTQGGREFITPLTLRALPSHPVYTDLLDLATEAAMGHIELARWADLVLIAPATADLMAHLAQGMANDLLTTLMLATDAQIVLTPVMNQVMWYDTTIQADAELLRQRGFHLLSPTAGSQACGDADLGRMLEAKEPAQRAADCFQCQALIGVHVLIIAGPTQENIDLVRYITNHSSEKMGFALAEAMAEAGARVTPVTSPVHLPMPDQVQRVDVVSARDTPTAYEAAMPCDLLIASATVTNYRLEVVAVHKLKRDPTSSEGLFLQLVRNPDILAILVQRKDCPFSVSSTVETESLLDYAAHKLRDKNLDLIVTNDTANPSIGFNSDENAITVIDRDLHPSIFAQISKDKIACQLITFIADYLNQQ